MMWGFWEGVVDGFLRLKVSRVRSNPVSVIVRVGPWRSEAFLELVMVFDPSGNTPPANVYGFGLGTKCARM